MRLTKQQKILFKKYCNRNTNMYRDIIYVKEIKENISFFKLIFFIK